jgi:hypothetical protein
MTIISALSIVHLRAASWRHANGDGSPLAITLRLASEVTEFLSEK